jgi:hypothetical protein
MPPGFQAVVKPAESLVAAVDSLVLICSPAYNRPVCKRSGRLSRLPAEWSAAPERRLCEKPNLGN